MAIAMTIVLPEPVAILKASLGVDDLVKYSTKASLI